MPRRELEVPVWVRSDGMTGFPDGPNLITQWTQGPWTVHGRRHDFGYAYNGTWKDKFHEDYLLASSLWSDPKTPITGKIAAPIVFLGVSTFGWLYWLKAKKRMMRVRKAYHRWTRPPSG